LSGSRAPTAQISPPLLAINLSKVRHWASGGAASPGEPSSNRRDYGRKSRYDSHYICRYCVQGVSMRGHVEPASGQQAHLPRDGRPMMTLTWICLTALSVWAFTRARAAARISRLRSEMARLHEEACREIERCRDETARARATAAQISRDAESWAAGHRQGRDDVFAMVPLFAEARDRLANPTEGRQPDGSRPMPEEPLPPGTVSGSPRQG